MAGFLGSYQHQLDAKGRVSLPVAYRKGHEDEPFVLLHKSGNAPALTLYAEDTWAAIQEQLLDLARSDPDHLRRVIRLTANAVEVVPDKQGRILLPESMREAIGLDSEVKWVGAINHIEIWDPVRFEEEEVEEDPAFQKFLAKALI